MYSVMRENPYRLAEDVSGVGFRIADEIAGRIGIHTDSDYRIRSGILYTLLQAVGEGHCYLPLEQLLCRGAELLGVTEDNIRPQVDNLIVDRKLVAKGEAVFAAPYYYAELNCANMLRNLNIPMAESENLPSQDMAIRKRLERMAEICPWNWMNCSWKQWKKVSKRSFIYPAVREPARQLPSI